MKAKVYAKQYLESKDKPAELGKIWIAFVSEVSDLVERRNVQTVNGMKSILSEQNDKWNAFCKKVNLKQDPTIHGVLLQDSFLKLLRAKFPELFYMAKMEELI